MKFFKLRDKVRRYAIENKIDKNEWIFEYLDMSLSRTISQLDNLHLLLTIILFSNHKKHSGFVDFKNRVQSSINSNDHAKEVYDEYTKLLTYYFYKKHYLIRFALFSSIKAIGFLVYYIFRVKHVINENVFQATYREFRQLRPVRVLYVNIKTSTNSIPFLPETSAMRQYFRRG